MIILIIIIVKIKIIMCCRISSSGLGPGEGGWGGLGPCETRTPRLGRWLSCINLSCMESQLLDTSCHNMLFKQHFLYTHTQCTYG